MGVWGMPGMPGRSGMWGTKKNLMQTIAFFARCGKQEDRGERRALAHVELGPEQGRGDAMLAMVWVIWGGWLRAMLRAVPGISQSLAEPVAPWGKLANPVALTGKLEMPVAPTGNACAFAHRAKDPSAFHQCKDLSTLPASVGRLAKSRGLSKRRNRVVCTRVLDWP